MSVQLSKTALAISVSLALWGCAAPQATAPRVTRDAAPVAAVAAPAPVFAPQRQDIGPGLYEIAYDATSASLLVAATPSFKDQAGVLYRLDPNTLAIKQTLPLGRRAFALGINGKTNMVFVGNTLDGSLTAVDATSGKVLGVSQLSAKNEKGEAAHTRKVIVDEADNRIFVTGPAKEGKVWIVDALSGQVRYTMDNVGVSPTGAAYDPLNKRLYVGLSSESNQIVVIDPEFGQIVNRLDAGDTAKHFFINLAIDPQGQRLFATDAGTGEVAVFDLLNRSLIKRIPVGLGALDIVYNPIRQEIYATSRGVSREQPAGTGKLTVIDARSYAVKRSWDLPVHPQSLALSPDGQVLFVTVKAAGNRHPAFKEGALESVVRVELN